jgi:DNA-binding PadR family transcriptional regulator
MMLTSLEREFLEQVSSQPWPSPPLFDHNLVVLVEAGLVQTESLPDGAVVYEITEAGRAEISG